MRAETQPLHFRKDFLIACLVLVMVLVLVLVLVMVVIQHGSDLLSLAVCHKLQKLDKLLVWLLLQLLVWLWTGNARESRWTRVRAACGRRDTARAAATPNPTPVSSMVIVAAVVAEAGALGSGALGRKAATHSRHGTAKDGATATAACRAHHVGVADKKLLDFVDGNKRSRISAVPHKLHTAVEEVEAHTGLLGNAQSIGLLADVIVGEGREADGAALEPLVKQLLAGRIRNVQLMHRDVGVAGRHGHVLLLRVHKDKHVCANVVDLLLHGCPPIKRAKVRLGNGHAKANLPRLNPVFLHKLAHRQPGRRAATVAAHAAAPARVVAVAVAVAPAAAAAAAAACVVAVALALAVPGVHKGAVDAAAPHAKPAQLATHAVVWKLAGGLGVAWMCCHNSVVSFLLLLLFLPLAVVIAVVAVVAMVAMVVVVIIVDVVVVVIIIIVVIIMMVFVLVVVVASTVAKVMAAATVLHCVVVVMVVVVKCVAVTVFACKPCIRRGVLEQAVTL